VDRQPASIVFGSVRMRGMGAIEAMKQLLPINTYCINMECETAIGGRQAALRLRLPFGIGVRGQVCSRRV
jgi:hypothetical protein